MSGNTFGNLFAVTNFGESHGPAIGCVIDGCPPGMELSEADIQPDLDRRRPGTSRHVTQRQEEDKVEILSGVYEGQTTGTPICLLIRNTDQRSKDYCEIAQKFRPGHADYTYLQKYGLRDPRGGGRASARLTAPMVAAGAVAKKWLAQQYGTVFRGCMQQIGEIAIPFESWDHVPEQPVLRPGRRRVARWRAYMDSLRKAGDSCGARIRVTASGMPVGLGEPLFDKLDADIAYAMMGINAVKGVEIGAGFASVAQRGTTHGDSLTPRGLRHQQRRRRAGRHQHRAGPGSVDRHQAHQLHHHARARPSTCRASPPQVVTKGRHDPCVGIRATPDRRGHAGAGGDGPCAAPARAKWRRQAAHGAHRLVVPLAFVRRRRPGSPAVAQDSPKAGRFRIPFTGAPSARSPCQTVPAPQPSSRTAITGRSSRARSTTPSSAATCKGT